MEELFRDFWWLIFPIFGMVMAVSGGFTSERRTRNVIDLIKTYTDQGKEPPPELLKLAAKDWDEDGVTTSPRSRFHDSGWTFFTFAALATGFGIAYWFIHPTEDWAWIFLAVAAGMGVMALGGLVMMFLARK
ncbi:MAG: hypothetical protein K2P58_00210 [Hyphomonadaceae bacterium]|nr:hypothetical protein [Hyphomonadaceae bacterium]